MVPRWLALGLALLGTSVLSCANQGKAVGTDVVEELCSLNREAILALHSPEGLAIENAAASYTYCDYWVDSNGDGVADAPEVQPSCKPISDADVDNVTTECKRNGTRMQSRCWQQMEAMLACLRGQLNEAADRTTFYTTNFNCWSDTNGNGSYDGGVYWTWPEDGSRPETELNHRETCGASLPVPCGQHLNSEGKPEANRCYLMQELPRKSDETIANGGVSMTFALVPEPWAPESGSTVAKSNVCGDEYVELNRCSKESDLYLKTSSAAASAGAAAVGTP